MYLKPYRRSLVHQGAPSIQRWYELPSAPLLGWLGVSAPLLPLGLGSPWYFRTPAYRQGISTGVSERGRLASGRTRLGWGVAPAPPSRAVNPFQGLFISFSSVSSRPIKAVWASLCLHAPVQRQGFTGVSRFVPVCRRNGLPCFFGAAIAGARTRRPSRAEQSRQCKHQTVKLDGYTALRPVLRSAGGSVVTAPAVAGAIVRPVCV